MRNTRGAPRNGTGDYGAGDSTLPRTRWRTTCELIVAAGLLLLLSAQLPDTPDRATEERAQALDRQLICPVCPGETLDQSQATLAKQMRAIIRERLASGQSEREVLDYFVSVYGDSVLAAPPRRGFGLLAWIVPPGALLIGASLVVVAIRRMRHPSHAYQAEEGPVPQDLEPYLALVDREMPRMDGGRTL